MLYDSGPFKKIRILFTYTRWKIAEMYTAISLCRKNMASDSNEESHLLKFPISSGYLLSTEKDLVK